MVPVGVMRDSAVPAGRPAHLQRPQRRATGFGRTGRRRGHVRRRPDNTRRPDLPETQVSEDEQTVASGMTTAKSSDITLSLSIGIPEIRITRETKMKKTLVFK